MQLTRMLALAALLGISAIAPVSGQSLSPMHKTGATPSDIKGIKVVVGNPYPGKMAFDIVPMEPGFETVAEGAIAQPARLVLAPGASRSVTFAFKIDPRTKERTIGLCIIPQIEGPIQPRVCGTYTGVRIGRGG